MAYPKDEVRALRKAGKPKEALALALGLCAKHPADKYLAGELAWALYDCMKEARGTEKGKVKDARAFAAYFAQVDEVNLAYEGNELFYQNLEKLYSSAVWNLQKADDAPALLLMLRALVSWKSHWARLSYSLQEKLLTYFQAGFIKREKTEHANQDGQAAAQARAQGMVELVEWYSVSHITRRSELFETKEYQGHQVPSEAERLIKAYLEALLAKGAGGSRYATEAQRRYGVEAVGELLNNPKTEQWVWPRYRYAQLLLEVKGPEEAREYFKQMLVAKPREAYLWRALGETYKDSDQEAYESCMQKAENLSHKTQNGPVDTEGEPSHTAESLLDVEAASHDFYIEWLDAKSGLMGLVVRKEGVRNYERLKVKDEHWARKLKAGGVYHGLFSKNYRQILSLQEVAPDSVFVHDFTRDFIGVLEQKEDAYFVRGTEALGVRSLRVPEYLLRGFEGVAPCKVKGHASKRQNRDGTKWYWFIESLEPFASC